jgi:hypothetical protein
MNRLLPLKNISKNKLILVILSVLIIISLALIFINFKNRAEKKAQKSSEQTSPNTSHIYYGTENDAYDDGNQMKIPEGFPAEIPVEFGSEIVLSKSQTNADGNSESSLEIASKQSIQENFTSYQNLLKKNGWEITGTTENKIIGNVVIGNTINATKDDKILKIKIYYDKIKQARVLFSYTIKK